MTADQFEDSEAKFKHITEMTILTVQLTVEFSKRLPGFDTLLREDQITLLKVYTSYTHTGSHRVSFAKVTHTAPTVCVIEGYLYKFDVSSIQQLAIYFSHTMCPRVYVQRRQPRLVYSANVIIVDEER